MVSEKEENSNKAVIQSDKTVFTVEYTSAEAATDVLIERIIHQLTVRESTLCVVLDLSMRQMLQEALSRNLPECGLLSIELNAPVSPGDIRLLKARIRQYETGKAGTEALSDDMRDIAGSLADNWAKEVYTVKPAGISPMKALDGYLRQDTETAMYVLLTEISAHPFTFEKGEYEKWYTLLQEAATLYSPDYRQPLQWHGGDPMLLSALNPDKMDEITQTLFLLREHAMTIQDTYYKYIHDIRTHWLQDAEAKYDDLEVKMEKLRQHLFHVHAKGANVKKMLAAQWQQLEKELLSIRLITRFVPLDGQLPDCECLENYLELLRMARQQLPRQADEFVKSVNLLNQEREELVILESEAQQCISYLNRQQIFSQPVEMNTISLQKQAAFIREVTAKIECALHQLYHNKGLLLWQGFHASLEGAMAKVVDVMCTLDPSFWLSAFDSWYKYAFIAESFRKVRPVSDADWHKATTYASKTGRVFDPSVFQIAWRDLQGQPAVTALHAFLQKGNSDEYPLLWADFLSSHATAISCLFPVVVTDTDHFYEWQSTDFPHLVYVDYLQPNVDIMQYFKSIVSWYGEGSLAAVPDYIVDIPANPALQHVTTLSRSQKLPFFRSLAEQCLQFERIPAVFGLRGGCCISFCGEGIHSLMLRELHRFGIKRVETTDHTRDTLLAGLLASENNIYLLVEDGLPDPEHPFTWQFQRQILQWLASRGCHIIHISTRDAFYSSGKKIVGLLSSIWEVHDADPLPVPSQLSLVFDE